MNILKQLYFLFIGKNKSEERQKEYLLKNGMVLGDNCHIYSYTGIDSGKPWLITIGNNVIISSNVTILTHDASPNIVGCGTKLGKVIIGNNVFIGTRSIILCNVKIADNVIVGAGSVVTHSLLGNAVYAGSPARRICSLEEYKTKYNKLRNESPQIDKIRPWNTWDTATEEEKRKMADILKMNCTPFVRQYDILNNKWGALLCRKEYQTNAIHQNSRSR